jgi:hypothetical protein
VLDVAEAPASDADDGEDVGLQPAVRVLLVADLGQVRCHRRICGHAILGI